MASSRLEVAQLGALVALAYYAPAIVCLGWAISPGFATMVWPSAGIALGAVYVGGRWMLAGVALGSFFANFVGPGQHQLGMALPSLIPAAGATLAAAVGSHAMHRILHHGHDGCWIWRPAMLLRFVAIASVCAAINAVWAPLFLAWARCIPVASLPTQIYTWWTGDAVGACVFAPLVVFLVEESREHRLRMTIDEVADMTKDGDG